MWTGIFTVTCLLTVVIGVPFVVLRQVGDSSPPKLPGLEIIKNEIDDAANYIRNKWKV